MSGFPNAMAQQDYQSTSNGDHIRGSSASPNRGFGRRIHVEVFRELQCPGCRELMEPPVNLCVRGHSVCFKCGQSSTECPKCDGELSSARNETLEAVMRHFLYPCKNQNCDQMVGLADRKRHED